ncbi:GFA family protein [Aestuariivirga litoralis]|uniref:GFA family protein n=1 Tax=Aestuariivirga litoralis TaxID=2650924 RepID=UPI0018C45675|nr:GFA family protein [Aestuariivirga litoralis]MBG1231129.1 GFA family protein [Aestuariivirga litoralis]
MITGSCHCGAVHWELDGDIGAVTACNCTACRRYGALWAYDYLNDRIRVFGETRSYVRKNADGDLGFHFCLHCGGMAYWLAIMSPNETRQRIAVNVRLADDPEAVAAQPIDHFDGLVTFKDRAPDGRCVRDMWY